MKKTIKSILLFLIINFGALALGGFLMQNGPQTDWYKNIHIAPGRRRDGFLVLHGQPL